MKILIATDWFTLIISRKDACLDGAVLDDHNGWLYENEQDHFKKLHSFLNSAEMPKTITGNAVKFARQTYSSTAFAEKVERVYLDMLCGSVENEGITCLGEAPCQRT